MKDDNEDAPLYIVVGDDSEWNNAASLTQMRDILNVAHRAFDPDFAPDDPVDPFDPGRSVKWGDTVNQMSGDYNDALLRAIGDPLASSIVSVIHDAFVMESRTDRVRAIIDQLRKDQDQISRVIGVMERMRGIENEVDGS